MYENVSRVNRMLNPCNHLPLEPVKFHPHRNLLSRHRQKEHSFKRAAQVHSLLSRQPFLKKGGKTVDIQHRPVCKRGHRNLAVTAHRKAVHIVPPTGPTVEAGKFIQRNLLFGSSTCENIVRPKSPS